MSVHVLKDSRFVPAGTKIAHGFFGREGGVSTGLYASLNCGAGTEDRTENVRENRARVALALNTKPENLVSLKQVHSADCLFVSAPWSLDQRPEADAFVTDVPGLALGILTADCGPVLFYGEKVDGQPVIGAAHAGWGGAVKGVLEATVKTMQDHDVVRDSIRASVGPCIAQSSYEVSADFITPFLNDNPESEHFFKAARSAGHLMFDLPGYIAFRLAGIGVRHVSLTGVDTYSSDKGYFSYRRATHRKESDYGRQISALVILP
ncbi:MAG: peptidoglycan editing factor PgeF [Micavibrio sp.]